MSMYFTTTEQREAHASALIRGLERLGPNFLARLCSSCGGTTVYRQRYNAGCGAGYYHSDGPCDWCDSTGLMLGTKPAPKTVVAQVLNAAAEP